MTIARGDLIKHEWTGTGTGTITLGAAVSGRFAFPASLDGETVTYLVEHQAPGTVEVELARGIYTHSGTTLTRAETLESTNGGSPVAFGPGPKHVSNVLSSSDLKALAFADVIDAALIEAGAVEAAKLASDVFATAAAIRTGTATGTAITPEGLTYARRLYAPLVATSATAIVAATHGGRKNIVDNDLILDNTWGAAEHGTGVQPWAVLNNVHTASIYLTLSNGESSPVAAILWTTASSVTSGHFRTYLASDGIYRLYSAGSTATTGATPPTHTTGAVSDGTVTWTHVRPIGLINTAEYRFAIRAAGTMLLEGLSNAGTAPVVSMDGDGITLDFGGVDIVEVGDIFCEDNLVSRPELQDYSETSTSPTNSAGTVVLNIALGNSFQHTLTANITTLTISNPSPTGKSCSFSLKITQDSTPRTIAWPASVDWPGGVAPTLSTGSGDVDIFMFTTWDAGTRWFGAVLQDFS